MQFDLSNDGNIEKRFFDVEFDGRKISTWTLDDGSDFNRTEEMKSKRRKRNELQFT